MIVFLNVLILNAVNIVDQQCIINVKFKPSDHSMLSCSFLSMNHTLYENVSTNTNENIHTKKKYKFNNAPPDFMNNEISNIIIKWCVFYN